MDDLHGLNSPEKLVLPQSENFWQRHRGFLREVRSIILIVILVFAFRSVFFEPFRIPSGSMIPTLMIGDFIVVNKFAYGFKLPFSDFVGDPIYLTKPKPVERGDIIVFKYPVDPSVNYIKRVIGLPGDVVEVMDKRVYINGQLLEIPEEVDATALKADLDRKFTEFNLHVYQTKTGTHEHLFIESDDIYDPRTAHKSRVQIPPDHYFVMGDNRDFSQDSRVWGFVPFKNIKGRAIAVWFSLALPSAETEFRFRWRRIGTVLH